MVSIRDQFAETKEAFQSLCRIAFVCERNRAFLHLGERAWRQLSPIGQFRPPVPPPDGLDVVKPLFERYIDDWEEGMPIGDDELQPASDYRAWFSQLGVRPMFPEEFQLGQGIVVKGGKLHVLPDMFDQSEEGPAARRPEEEVDFGIEIDGWEMIEYASEDGEENEAQEKEGGADEGGDGGEQ